MSGGFTQFCTNEHTFPPKIHGKVKRIGVRKVVKYYALFKLESRKQ